jgi:peptidoglycan/xylan/chitin deacetylase (PgdA/CDA1 family)
MRWTGVIRLFQFIHRNQIIILTIHGVMDDTDNTLWKPLRRRLSRHKLKEYLNILSKRYRFISLVDAVDMLQGRKHIQPYSIVITFDDGYRNNLTHALPILKDFNAPATFFIPTGFIDNPRPFWFDRLDYAFQQVQVSGRKLKVGSFTMHLDGSSRYALQESYRKFRYSIKKQNMSDSFFLQEMERIAANLEAESGRSLKEIQDYDDWSAIMTWNQIETLHDDSVAFGSHTVDHIRLGLVEKEIARDQLTRSKYSIESHTGRPCQCLCFPNGNYKSETIALAKECGYTCCFTTDEGLNYIGCDVMTLRRIHLANNVNPADLLFSLSVTCS